MKSCEWHIKIEVKLLSLILLLSFWGCYAKCQSFQDITLGPNDYIFQNSNLKIEEFIGDIKFTQRIITSLEAKKAKSLAMECVKERNASIYKKLNRYIVQYVGLEAKEIKIVYINFFIPTKYDDPSRFSKSIPLVMDGGDRYFSLMLNLKNETCFNFHVNHEL